MRPKKPLTEPQMTVMTGGRRAKWPWGRTAPDRRLSDLEHQKAVRHAQISIVHDRAREAVARIEKSIEAIESEMETVRSFQLLERRERCKELAYRLAEAGIDRIADVDACGDIASIEKMEAQLRRELERSEGASGEAADEIDEFFRT